MAVTTKTLTPTNQVVTIPDMTERPNASVLADGISKLSDAVNKLDSDATPDDFTSSCTRLVNFQTLKCKKVGNIIIICGRLGFVEIGTTNVDILTLPSGYRPSEGIYAPSTGQDGSGANPIAYGVLDISAQGNVRIKNNTSAFYNNINVTYCI